MSHLARQPQAAQPAPHLRPSKSLCVPGNQVYEGQFVLKMMICVPTFSKADVFAGMVHHAFSRTVLQSSVNAISVVKPGGAWRVNPKLILTAISFNQACASTSDVDKPP